MWIEPFTNHKFKVYHEIIEYPVGVEIFFKFVFTEIFKTSSLIWIKHKLN